ncbi:MAG: HlyD family secretion protein [Gammaproteobacteria bacterium]|nr:HlyD family secretion protein [Gammaproteobacteria bacterium]
MEIPVEKGGGRGRRLALGGIAVLAAAAGLGVWWQGRNVETTDDAFIQADIVAIGPKIPGTVVAVHVADNQAVRAGDVLLELDPADYQARLDQAQANLDAAQAALDAARADLALTRERAAAGVAQAEAALRSAQAEAARAGADAVRYAALYRKDEISRQLLDQAEASARSLEARVDEAQSRLRDAQTAPRQVALKETVVASRAAEVAQARAALEQARLNLSYTRIVAPRDGKVTKKNVQAGTQVQVGAALLAIVGDRPWVVANFKETQLGRIKPGQPVGIRVDAYPGVVFAGHVDSFQSGTGSVFSLLPPENATGNFVKVVQRVPVKLVFDAPPDDAHRLVPGMSAVPRVDVGGAPQAVASAR